MRTVDILRAAVRNSFRSRLRTSLTVIAIFIGAFTLTITNGLGTGINNYIDTQLNSFGDPSVMTVTKPVEAVATEDGPAKYDPDAAEVVDGGGQPGSTVTGMTDTDLDAIRALDNVVSAEAAVRVSPDFIDHDGGTKYELAVSAFSGLAIDLVAGDELDQSGSTPEIVLSSDYVEPLGYASNEDAVGTTVSIGITDGTGEQHVVEATVAGVQDPSLLGSTATMNDTLTSTLFELQNTGLPVSATETFASATVRFDKSLTDPQIATLKADLVDAGYSGTTVADQLGSFKTVIDGIILVLNAFAVIALIAAGFGIINTLLMSVQERTREIGLMKAMGMSGGRIFGLFSTEAVFIGFLGSAIGSVLGIALGSVVSAVLSQGLLANLGGLQVIAFTPAAVATVLLLVMGIALVAAVLPASRAARQSPIDSLRYE